MLAAMWVVPAERMKGGREHRIPISGAALNVLREMAHARLSSNSDAFVFPGRDVGRPLSDMSLTAVLRRIGRGDLTAHGFRSSFRDWAAETTAYPTELVEMALAHAVGNKVEAAYRRGDLFEKRRQLMDDWAAYCSTTNNAHTPQVVSLRERSR
jgi:integrase